MCRVNSVKLEGRKLKLRLIFGVKDKEEWFGELADEPASEETGGEAGTACYTMQARTKDWLSTPFSLTRAS